MISAIQQILSGNALRLFIEPPANAIKWRILRKGADTFSGHDDVSALVVHEGTDRVFLDIESLTNDTPAFYRVYYWDGTNWTASPTSSGTPVAEFAEVTTDTQTIVRDRIERGLQVEVARGNFITELGYIQVYTAPPSLEQNLQFPCVTITLSSESPAETAIGADIFGDDPDGADYFESEGWIAQVQLEIVAWSLNSDERLELRKALRRIIIANRSVFASRGIVDVKVDFQDVDAVSGEFNAPMYQAMASFSCLAPVRVGINVDSILDTEVTATYG